MNGSSNSEAPKQCSRLKLSSAWAANCRFLSSLNLWPNNTLINTVQAAVFML